MHGIGLDEDVRHWSEFRAPGPKVPKHFVERALLDRGARISPNAPGGARI